MGSLHRFLLPVLAAALLLSGCYSSGPRKELPIYEVQPLDLLQKPVERFARCSPYYDMNFVDVSLVEDPAIADALKEALRLAAEDRRMAAWDAIAPRVNAAWSDPTALLASCLLLGGVLENAPWTVQVRWGPFYRDIVLRLVKLQPDSRVIRMYYAMYLIQSPPTMGGNLKEGEKRMKVLEGEGLADHPAVLYGLWFAADSQKDETAAVSFADRYLAACPLRPEVSAWRQARIPETPPEPAAP